MADIQKLTASIQSHEGLRLRPYVDSRGYLTIGYGRNLDAKGITNDEATYLLGNDIQSSIREAQAQYWWQYVANDDVRSRACVEIVFNIGIGGMSGFHDALAAMARGDWAACGAAFLDSLWSKQVGQRAEVLASMIISGLDPE